MRPVVLVLLAAVCFGSTGTAVALGASGSSPLAVGAARIAVGGALLAAVAAWPLLRRGSGVTAPSARLVGVVVVGAVGVVAYQPLFFAGTRTNGVAVGTVVALGSAPLVTGLLAWVLTGVRPGRRWTAATAVAVVGLALLAVSAGEDAAASPLGLLASVGAGASYSVFALVTKRLLDAGWGPTGSVGAVFGLAAVLSVPVLLVTGVPAGAGGLAVALWLGVVTTALAYVLFSTGLRELTAPTAATLTLAEPLTATLLGLLVLGEHLTAAQAAALLLVATGLAVLAAPTSRRPRRARVPA
ncbi:DMT family transporter [Streptomyces sp. NP160]|uniref:DMT family transporter n=1 Tax=Streptomyces sp. NP160 TaxID=2586637 RepID=UPI001118325A|nr:DMT family transporter [Streptomyces sp. NP160]TNM68296.1 DMT family transporter [Streptomyces sp. NP160]